MAQVHVTHRPHLATRQNDDVLGESLLLAEAGPAVIYALGLPLGEGATDRRAEERNTTDAIVKGRDPGTV